MNSKKFFKYWNWVTWTQTWNFLGLRGCKIITQHWLLILLGSIRCEIEGRRAHICLEKKTVKQPQGVEHKIKELQTLSSYQPRIQLVPTSRFGVTNKSSNNLCSAEMTRVQKQESLKLKNRMFQPSLSFIKHKMAGVSGTGTFRKREYLKLRGFCDL